MKKKFISKYWEIFLSVSFVIFLISLFVIDPHSPLEVEALRVSWFGLVWNGFILPGEIIFLWPLLWCYEAICSFYGGCPGVLDGGPGEPYFFFALSLCVGLLYGVVALAVYRIFERLRLRK